MDNAIVLENISKKYNENVIFSDFNLSIERNKVICILGGSGKGKTTLLSIIAGLIDCEGVVTRTESPSYIFQEDRLIPGISVGSNLELVIRSSIKNGVERKALVLDILNVLELSGQYNSLPRELSGGMSQRVAMARAFLYDSNILLMDEPFKTLDISLKDRLIQYFLSALEKKNRTVVFVTHDIYEALLIADRIIVIGSHPCVILQDISITIDKRTRDIFSGELENIKHILYDTLKAAL